VSIFERSLDAFKSGKSDKPAPKTLLDLETLEKLALEHQRSEARGKRGGTKRPKKEKKSNDSPKPTDIQTEEVKPTALQPEEVVKVEGPVV
jgi:hypothetical protein